MGTTYNYTNLTKREWFSVGAFGESAKRGGLGRTLASRAFDLLLVGGRERSGSAGPVRVGRWAGDSVVIVGDTDEDWPRYRDEFVDLDADVILLICAHDGFDEIGTAADRDDGLFVQLCHLVVTRQALQLEPHMRRRFGSDFPRRYKELNPKMHWCRPKDVGRAGGE